MAIQDKPQVNSNLALNALHDHLTMETHNRVEREKHTEQALLSEVTEDLTQAVEQKKRSAKEKLETATKKDVAANSARLAPQVAGSKQGPSLSPPLEEKETETGSLFPSITDDDGENSNFIAVMSQAMTAGIRCSQTIFQMDWNQTTSDWQNQIAHAPLIQQAIENSGIEQAAATQDEADMSKQDGIGLICASGLGLAVGGWGAYSDATKDAVAPVAAKTSDTVGADAAETAATKAASAVAKEVTETAGTSAGQAARTSAAEAGEASANGAARNIEAQVANAQKKLGVAEAAKGAVSKSTKLMQSVYEGFLKTAQVTQMFQLMSQGATGVSVDSPKKSDQANHQRNAQQQQAYSESFQLHASGYGEHYNKGEDARQAVAQSIEFFLNLYQQLPGTITQALSTYRAA